MPDRITVLGAGVSGLTSGVVLAEAGRDVTILAADVENTTSHAAAAIWLPYHITSDRLDAWALETCDVLTGLADDPSTGVSIIEFDVFDQPPPRCIAAECVPLGSGGFRARVPLMDTTRYLPYLRRRFERAGGKVVIQEVRPEDLTGLPPGPIVNCTGFRARALFGDYEMEPGYGIAVIAPRPPIDRAVAAATDSESLMYVIPRLTDCVLGGYDRPVPPRDDEVATIVRRCREVVPEVSEEVLSVRRGIRAVRPAVRVQRSKFFGRDVVHNYGHGGAGFTVSWACAREVKRLLERSEDGAA